MRKIQEDPQWELHWPRRSGPIIWYARCDDGAPDLLYIDLMLMHEVTSPQAFEGLRLAGRKPRHVDQLIATEDHNTPTVDIDKPNPDETSRCS